MTHDPVMPSALPRPMMTTREVSDWLNVSRSTVYRLTTDKKLRASRFRGSLRFHPEDVETFLTRVRDMGVADQPL